MIPVFNSRNSWKSPATTPRPLTRYSQLFILQVFHVHGLRLRMYVHTCHEPRAGRTYVCEFRHVTVVSLAFHIALKPIRTVLVSGVFVDITT